MRDARREGERESELTNPRTAHRERERKKSYKCESEILIEKVLGNSIKE